MISREARIVVNKARALPLIARHRVDKAARIPKDVSSVQRAITKVHIFQLINNNPKSLSRVNGQP
jgi:hypothetical protein